MPRRSDSASVFLFLAILTGAVFWPLPLEMASGVPHDALDPILNTWILWWNASNVPFTSAWWNAPAFHPARDVLAYSEHLAGIGVISSPLIWATGSPLLAYNTAFVLSFPLCGLAAFWLARTVTGRRDAALVAALAFAFAPYRMAQQPHLQVLSSYWLPIVFLGLHRFAAGGHPAWLGVFAAATILQALCNGYFLLFMPLLIGAWALWFLGARRRWRELAYVTGVTAAAYVALTPALIGYLRVSRTQGLTRAFDEVRNFSADIAALVTAEPTLALWGWLRVFPRAEGELFPGVAVTAMVVAGLLQIAIAGWRRSDAESGAAGSSQLLFYALAAVAMWAVCLGPAPTLMGAPAAPSWLAPYRWLAELPGFSGLRVPTRAWTLATLGLAIAAAASFVRIAPVGSRRRPVLLAALSLAIVAEAWPGQVVVARPPGDLPPAPHSAVRSPVVELPMGTTAADVAAMYRGIRHQRPVVNGFSGFAPPLYRIVTEGLNHGSEGLLRELAVADGLTVVLPAGPRRTEFDARFSGNPAGAMLVDRTAEYSIYRVPPQSPARDSQPLLGPPLPISALTSNTGRERLQFAVDGDRTTRWRTGPQRPRHRLTIDLGTRQRVGAVVLELGRFAADFPRDVLVEASANGRQWRTVWSGSTAAHAFQAALREPLVVPLTLALSPPVPARYLQLRLQARDEVFHWSVAELRVHGP